MILLTPIIAGLLYRAGGTDQWTWCPLNQKWWRWLMGIPIGLISFLFYHNWIVIPLAGIAYYIATAAFKYGAKSWLNFLGEEGKFAMCGLAFGACAFTVTHWYWALIQTIVSGLCFWFIKVLDDKKIIQNPWVEFLRGFLGTMFIW